MQKSPTLAHLTNTEKKQTAQDILEHHEKNPMTIIHFLYYANYRRFFGNAEYQNILRTADFLLPDGIALRLLVARIKAESFWNFLKQKTKYLREIPNLNGTDFVPYFLEYAKSEKIPQRIFLYGATEESVTEAKRRLNELFPEAEIFAQNGFEPLDEAYFAEKMQGETKQNIVLVGLGTPKQELWIEEKKEMLTKFHPIVFSVGGLFDFLGGTEKRTPKWIQKINGEWLYRAITNPKKNLTKTLRSLRVFPDLLFYQRETRKECSRLATTTASSALQRDENAEKVLDARHDSGELGHTKES